MARKAKAVNGDNIEHVSIGGFEFDLEASLGAGIIYQNEFRDKAEKPYTGNLYEDALQLMREAELEETYYGFSTQLFGITWAMARAAGSFSGTYDEFIEMIEHSPANLYEIGELYGAVMHRLGERTIFRLPERLRDAVESDAEERAEAAAADGGSGDVG